MEFSANGENCLKLGIIEIQEIMTFSETHFHIHNSRDIQLGGFVVYKLEVFNVQQTMLN